VLNSIFATHVTPPSFAVHKNCFDVVPDELFLFIFSKPTLTLKDLGMCAQVCRRWHILVKDPACLQRFLSILKKFYLIPDDFPKESSWQCVRENYLAKCEIFVDISCSMCVKVGNTEEFLLSPLLHKKTEEVISELLCCVKQVELLPFSNGQEEKMHVTTSTSLERTLKKLDAFFHGGTNIDILTKRLENYAKESQKFWCRKKIIFVISDLNFKRESRNPLIARIEKIGCVALNRKNFTLVFVEVDVNPSQKFFKNELNTLLKNTVISSVNLIESQTKEEESDQKGIKRKREGEG
jgi:hypothetical protein